MNKQIKTPFATSTAKMLLERFPNWYFFKIDPGTKAGGMPLGNISTAATNDPKEIAKWPINSNVGLALKKSGLIVADIDVKAGKRGATTLGELELEHGAMPETYTVRTGSGGAHYYYTETDAAKHVQGQNRFGLDIDCPGYVLIAGCQVDGKFYTTTTKAGKLAPAPGWFADYLKVTEAAESDQIPAVEQDSPTDVKWAIDYLMKDAPPSIQFQNGERTTLLVAAALKDHGISEDKAIELMAEFYNDRCEPPWSFFDGETADRMDLKIHNAWLYLKQNQPGSRTAAAAFDGDLLTEAEIDQFIVADLVWRAKRDNAKLKRGIGDNSGNNGGLVVFGLDTVKSRNVDFIWPGRLARGKHTALAGIGGIGKSQITIDAAARITNGSAWPDIKEIRAAGWPKNLERAPQGYVIIMSAEDAPDDTIKPRLIAAGGNPKFVKFLSMVKDADGNERKFNLQTDLERLKKYCLALGNVVLIVIDPASSYMGGDIDAGKNTKVRHVLDPITKLAEDLQCAIVSITHFRKGTSAKAVEKVMDSVAFVNAPRCALAVYEDPSDIGAEFDSPGYVMLRLKSNLPGTPPVGLAYRIEGVEGGSAELTDYRDGKPIKTSKIVWQGKTDLTADQVAQMENDKGTPKLDEARKFLADALPEGVLKPVSEVMAQAEAEGLAPDTVKRAKRALKVKAKKSGPEAGAPWVWYRGRELDLD